MMIHKYYNTSSYSNKSLLRPEYWNIDNPEFVPRIYTTSSLAKKNTNTAPIYHHNDHFFPQPQTQKRKFVTNTAPLYLKVPNEFRAGRRLPPHPNNSIPDNTNKPSNKKIREQEAEINAHSKSRLSTPEQGGQGKNFPTPSSSSSSSQRSTSVGLAEQLRRSRESNTFALIDSELSKSPLGRIRDLYLNLRGVNSNSGNAPRTTKKANLSAVHTIVRFRIKEYLLEMREHSRKLAETLVSHDPSYNSPSDLLTPCPCAKDCPHCDKIQGARLEPRRTLQKKPPSVPFAQAKNVPSNNQRSPVVKQYKSPTPATTTQLPYDCNNNNLNELMDIKPTIGITSSESNKSCDYSSPPDFPSPSEPISSDFEDLFYSSSIMNEKEVMLTSLSANPSDEKPPVSKRTHNDSFNPTKNLNDYFIDSLNWSPCEMDFNNAASVDIEGFMGSHGFEELAESLYPVSTDEELPLLVS